MVGDAGIGKSRLVHEALSLHSGARVFIGRCQQTLEYAYLPLQHAIFPALAALVEVSPILRRHQPAIHEALGIAHQSLRPGDDVAATAIAASRRAQQLVGLCEAILELARVEPTVLAIEDVHWADRPTLDLVDHLVMTLAALSATNTVPLAVMLTARAGSSQVGGLLARLGNEEIAVTVELDGLAELDVAEMIGQLSADRVTRRDVRRVWELSQGNPLLVTALAGGIDVTSVDRLSNATPADPIRVLGATVATLEPDTLGLMATASCWSGSFTKKDLAHLSDSDPERLEVQLCEGIDAGVLVREHDDIDFSHPLYREILYGQLVATTKRATHLRIADVLKDGLPGAGRGDERLIAAHVIAAGELAPPSRTLAHARAGGDTAFALAAWQEAARCFDAALVAADQLGLGVEEVVDLELRSGVSWLYAGDTVTAAARFDVVIERREGTGSLEQLGRAWVQKLQCLAVSPNPGSKVDGHRVGTLVAKLKGSHPALAAEILANLAQLDALRFRFESARRWGTRALEVGEPVGANAALRAPWQRERTLGSRSWTSATGS